MREILEAIDRSVAAGRRAALATVVHVTGSAYRREGAKMLLLDDGTQVGTISGGCLEADVSEAAGEVIRTGEPRLLHYDLTADDDVVWGLGLGCNGTVDVYVEPLDETIMAGYVERWRRAVLSPERMAVVTVVATPGRGPLPGTRMYVYEHRQEGSLGYDDWDRLLVAEARVLLEKGASRTFVYPLASASECSSTPDPGAVIRNRKDVLAGRQRGISIFIESVVPAPRVVVLGAGHDAIPVVHLARMAGFRVEVYDNRPAFATHTRFPAADRVICGHPGEVLRHIKFDRFTYVVLMTHNYNHDRDLLIQIWNEPWAYLGLLGPWSRTQKLLADLQRAGLDPGSGADRLYGPIGLNIGAEGPEQIAIAVVAEILAVYNGRPAGFLRFHRGSIHGDDDKADR